MSMPWFNEKSVVEYDIEKAKQILEEAGWLLSNEDGIRRKGDLKAEFNLIYPAGDSVDKAWLWLFLNRQKIWAYQFQSKG